jgi:polyisoprenoid-binding protein YceI/rhodanese-related sulfurtransferase
MVKEISAKEISELENKKLINVLPSDAYALEHISGSENVCVYETAFMDKMKELVPGKDTKIVVHGLSAVTEESNDAAEKLEKEGYTEVLNFKEGIEGWKEAGLEVEKGNVKEKGEAKEYAIDTKESRVEWTGRNIGNKHNGGIGIKSGEVKFGPGELSGEMVLDMDKLTNGDIGDEKTKGYLVSHLKSPDFFDTTKHPEAKIVIKKAEELGDENKSKPNFKITAELEIKGIKNEIEFPASVHIKEGAFSFNAHFSIDRTKWNVKYGSENFFAKMGMHLISDMVSFDVILVGK